MSRRGYFHQILVVLFIVMLASCSKFRKIEKSSDWRVKYDAALKYYENKDYFRSSTLFEQILPIVRGLPEGEKVQLYYAYAHYYQKFYLLAAHHFKTFYQTYGRSEYMQEARYMHAYSLYANAPAYNLDQSSSIEAVIEMQNFLNKYPNSQYREDANKVINELQVKLELKAYENSKQYYKLGYYKAAVVAFESFANDYPDSEYNEELSFLKFMAQFKLAEKSVSSKQLERYKLANQYYLEFLDAYPNSEFVKEADKNYGNSLDKVNQLAKK